MDISDFVKKYFVEVEPLPKNLDDSQIELVGRIVDLADIEGQHRLELLNGKKAVTIPSPASVPRSDSFFLYGGRVYRVMLHLKPVKEFPTNIKIHLELCREARMSMLPLWEEVTPEGYLVLYVYTIYRAQITKFFPLVSITFEKEEVKSDDISGEDSGDISGETKQGTKGSKRKSKPRSKQGAESGVSEGDQQG